MSCATILGDPNNEHRNDDFFENMLALLSIIVLFLLAWLLFDDHFTFGQGYIIQQFGLIVPDDKGFDNLGFSPTNALGLLAGVCLGEAVRNIVHLFEPIIEDAVANDLERKNTWVALDPMTHASAEICALVYDLDSRTSRITMTAFAAIHQLDDDQKNSVLALFDKRSKNFKRLPSLLKPIRNVLTNDSRVSVAFFEQIVKVGVASGHIDPRYIDRLKMLARALGIEDSKAQNILDTNGFTAYRQQFENAQSQQQYRSSYSDKSGQQNYRHRATEPLNETEKHLAVLGLKKGASRKQIKSAYRKMAKKYHPDLLKSKNLNEAQMADAAKTMLEINAAYEWLEG